MVLNETASLLAQSLRETEDELTRNVLAATAGFYNCTGGVDGQNPTELTRIDINNVIRMLVTANAKRITETIEGENRFGTGPIRQAFFAMCHTNLIPNMEAVAGFIPVAQYPSQMNILQAEWGSVSNLRFLVSSLGSIVPNASSTNQDVYNVFVTGLKELARVKSRVIDLDLLRDNKGQAEAEMLLAA